MSQLNFSDSRKMATIRIISEIRPIEGADAIELAIVDGWQVVVKRGEFQPGDSAVYFELDSWIPEAIAPFLTKKGQTTKEYNGVPGNRLRTVKLRGEISQGLLLKPEDVIDDRIHQDTSDLDRLLNIQKWEPSIPACLTGIMRGNFPSHLVPKTDLERVQNLSWSDICGKVYEITQKLDGTSATYIWNNGDFHVCSRNISLSVSEENAENTYVKMANTLRLQELMSKFGRNIAIQGEIIGSNIQKNPEHITGQQFRIFSMYDIDKQRSLRPVERWELFRTAEWNDLPLLQHVPVLMDQVYISTSGSTTLIQETNTIGRATKSIAVSSIDDLLIYASGTSSMSDAKLREGVVFKEIGTEFKFKVISNDYLLKSA